MAIYITKGKFSAEGARGLVSNPTDRAAVVSKLIEAAGGKLLNYFFTMGDSDFLIISEGDDANGGMAALLVSAASGSFSDLSTCQAWTSAEFTKVAERAGNLAISYTPPGKG